VKIKIAVLSDIHGNSWALQKVLEDIAYRQADIILNLGDSFYGPLDIKGTYDLIRSDEIMSISGNEDRLLLEKGSEATLDDVKGELTEEISGWIKSLPKTGRPVPGIFMCHGSPSSDTTYLTEQISDGHVSPRGQGELMQMLNGLGELIIFCGHSHLQRVVQTPGKVIVNPGSVGCPAFEDDFPVYHSIENFSNFARYCMVEWDDDNLVIDMLALAYDSEKAASYAEKRNRPDWVKWLKTGRV
jgi:predicted phosphodiesterase